MSRIPQQGLNTPGDFAEFTQKAWRDLDGFYRFHTDRWRRTLEYIRGQHWNALKLADPEKLPTWKKYPRVNFTLSYYAEFLKNWLKSEVRFSSVPESEQPKDISAANTADQLMKYMWDKLDFSQHRIDLAAWLMSTGNGVLRFYWDTDTGDKIPLAIPTPQGLIPINPDTLQPDPGRPPTMVDKGEIGVEVISPQFVRYAPTKSGGVMLGLLLTEDEVISSYGEEAAEQLTFSDTHVGLSFDLNQIEAPTFAPRNDKRALIIEHYLPKSSTNSNGLWWTTAGQGDILLTGPWPLPAGIIPIANFRWVPVPGDRNLGMSPLYDITYSNKIYDEMLARILEWSERTVPKTLLKVGGGIAKGDITSEPGQELAVNPGGEPEVMEFSSPPGTFGDLLNMAGQDMFSVSGKQWVKPDELKPGATLRRNSQPVTMNYGDEVALAIMNSQAGWEKAGQILLSYVGTFYTDERVMVIQGPDKSYQWRAFKGTDLANLAASVHVDQAALFPWNRQEIRETVIGLLSSPAGAVMFADEAGQPDQKKIRRALEASGLDVSLETLDEDTAEARNEEMRFQNMRNIQEAPRVQPWQDHSAHWESHKSVPKSIEFQAWKPEAQQAFLQHLQETEQILNQMAQEEAQAMIDQERQLREVREQAELRADVQRKLAEAVIDLVITEAGLTREELIRGILMKQLEGGSPQQEA